MDYEDKKPEETALVPVTSELMQEFLGKCGHKVIPVIIRPEHALMSGLPELYVLGVAVAETWLQMRLQASESFHFKCACCREPVDCDDTGDGLGAFFVLLPHDLDAAEKGAVVFGMCEDCPDAYTDPELITRCIESTGMTGREIGRITCDEIDRRVREAKPFETMTEADHMAAIRDIADSAPDEEAKALALEIVAVREKYMKNECSLSEYLMEMGRVIGKMQQAAERRGIPLPPNPKLPSMREEEEQPVYEDAVNLLARG